MRKTKRVYKKRHLLTKENADLCTNKCKKMYEKYKDGLQKRQLLGRENTDWCANKCREIYEKDKWQLQKRQVLTKENADWCRNKCRKIWEKQRGAIKKWSITKSNKWQEAVENHFCSHMERIYHIDSKEPRFFSLGFNVNFSSIFYNFRMY